MVGAIFGGFVGVLGSQAALYRNVGSGYWNKLPKWLKYIYRISPRLSETELNDRVKKYRYTDVRTFAIFVLVWLGSWELIFWVPEGPVHIKLYLQLIWVIPHIIGWVIATVATEYWIVNRWYPKIK